MMIKIVPSSTLTARTLRAKDYVLVPFEVTWTETVVRNAIIHLPADSEEKAALLLEAMVDGLNKTSLVIGERKVVSRKNRVNSIKGKP